MGTTEIEDKGQKRELGSNNLVYVSRRVGRKGKGLRAKIKREGEVWDEIIRRLGEGFIS